MHSICRLSTRWHQQFCRSPSFAGHQRCLQALLPVREYRQATKDRRVLPREVKPAVGNEQHSSLPEAPTIPEITVREYERDEGDPNKLRRIDPNQDVNFEIDIVKTQMAKLEKELAVMRQGPFGPQSDFMQSFPRDDREQLLKALANEGILQNEEEDLLTMAELERLSEEDEQIQREPQKRFGVTLRLPRKDQAYVRHFNKALRESQEDAEDIQKSLSLWKWYLRCQQQVSGFSNIISEDVWEHLWKTQLDLKARPKHIAMLAKDMLDAGNVLDGNQWLAYIEALHSSGNTSSAVELWQSQKGNTDLRKQQASRFWTIGVSLFAELGRPLKAQELAYNALRDRQVQAHILIPVIAAWARRATPESLVRAWACYLKLRTQMGASIDQKVFEDISNAFLDANCGDMALSVFKDMLLFKEQSPHDSREVYRQATTHFKDVLNEATSEEQINRVGLSALLILPRRFQNRFFFTSWIKKLIGEGRIDSAAMVVELMFERGIIPDAKPLNGIIGAWLRMGSRPAQQKAEKLAQSMIEARIDFVKNKAVPSEHDRSFRKVMVKDTRQPVSLTKPISPATIETFSIMIQHHTRRADFATAEQLTETMTGPCQIKPNSFILNHWLYSDLRASNISDLWKRYSNLKSDITPDLETFAVLWDAAKVQYSRLNPVHAEVFPTARLLQAEMIGWLRNTPLHSLRHQRAHEDFSVELYDQIIRCFCLSNDLAGTLCAIYSLWIEFGMSPTDSATRLVCDQLARLLPQEQRGRLKPGDPRIRRSSGRHKHVLTQVVDIVGTIEARRSIDLVEQGKSVAEVEDPSSDIGKELRLKVLNELIVMFMVKTQSRTGSYQNDINIAAHTMGVQPSQIDTLFPMAEGSA